MASKFPYRQKDTKTLEEGERIARARYHQDLRGMAQSLIEEQKKYPDQEISEMIDQAADNAVIYTRNAIDILSESDNWTAIEDVGDELSADNVTQAVTAIAYWAYRQDLSEYVEAYAAENDIEINPKRRRKKKRPTHRNAGRQMTKAQFERYFKNELVPHLGHTDRTALRTAWNDTIDAMIRDGSLPERAGDWSHPKWIA